MAKKADSAALATTGGDGLQMADSVEIKGDWLGDYLGDEDLDVTGTEGMGAEDVRLPTWALNAKSGTDADTGRAVPPDVFWNTLTEKSKPVLRLVVLTNMKSREWRAEDPSTGDLVVKCRSFDCVTGEMSDGVTRACDGCPDYAWHTDASGKRGRNCGDVYNVLGWDRETQEVGMIRVKKTAIKPFKNFYQKNFHKKRPKKDKTGRTQYVDLPFFAVETTVQAEKNQNDKFTWYTPKFDVGGILPREEIVAAAALVKSYMGEQMERVSNTIAAEENVIDVPGDGASKPSENIDPAAFSDDAEAAAPNRF